MDTNEVLKEFEDAGAILKGHFILSSGLHADTYLQCALVLQDASRAERLCKALADKVKKRAKPDLVVSPAMGGIVVGYEMGRQLNIPSIFCERVDGKFSLRRGFAIAKGAKVLIVEDVVTTGKSSLEAAACITEHGGEVIAEASLINRSGQPDPLGDIPLISLAELHIETWEQDNLPSALRDIPAIKPGSRNLS